MWTTCLQDGKCRKQNSAKPLETQGISTIVEEERCRAEVIGLIQLLSVMERTRFDSSCKLISPFLLPLFHSPPRSLLLFFFLVTWSYVAQASLELICSWGWLYTPYPLIGMRYNTQLNTISLLAQVLNVFFYFSICETRLKLPAYFTQLLRELNVEKCCACAFTYSYRTYQKLLLVLQYQEIVFFPSLRIFPFFFSDRGAWSLAV